MKELLTLAFIFILTGVILGYSWRMYHERLDQLEPTPSWYEEKIKSYIPPGYDSVEDEVYERDNE